MAIKVSTLLAHNTNLVLDQAPILGGDLDTNDFEIANGGNSVKIAGNDYPANSGSIGQVLTTDGFGTLSWQIVSGTGTVTSVGLASPNLSISVSGSPITTAGTFNVDLPLSGVISGPYGSASSVATFTVNSRGIVTAASNAPISITPSQAGLGNVANSLQVINAGGAPSIREGTGIPAGTDTPGAIYIDRGITNGDGIYFYDGANWQVVAQKLRLYDEKTNGFVAPFASGINSVAIGSGATASATGSFAAGAGAKARISGMKAFANGSFATAGSAQHGIYVLRNSTTDNAWTEVFIDGAAVQLVPADNSVYVFDILVAGRRTDAVGGGGGYRFVGLARKDTTAGSITFVGAPSKTVIGETNSPWDARVTTDTINGAIRIEVRGETVKDINWVATVTTAEVTN